MLKELAESRDLNIYKKMLAMFGDFVDRYPGSGIGMIYRDMLEAGLKCVPKDKKAQEILSFVLSDNAPKAVQGLLNTRFVELPVPIRPTYKSGNTKIAAFWSRDGTLLDKVYDLLGLRGESAGGAWVDPNGEKVTLLAMETVED